MKVLIVDDEQLARDRLARMLSDMNGYDVVGQAANGMQAVEQCGSTQPDVVLLDIRMPGMDGLEAARHLASMEEPPVISLNIVIGTRTSGEAPTLRLSNPGAETPITVMVVVLRRRVLPTTEGSEPNRRFQKP